MYVVARITPNRVTALMWKEVFETGGVPALIWPDRRERHLADAARYVVLVPVGKEHVAEEALRNAG
ncbi:MAG: hypothetical protein NZ518_02030 [Dehalococcoidia bacterium]|nr:hypothetical protein [Dehalococcoidia bacterium]